MKKMAIVREDEVQAQQTYPVPVEVTGLVSSKLLSPADYVLWLCVSELEEGAELRFPEVHSDQALYVFSGELEVGGRCCPEGGAIIVESNVPATVEATKASRIGHWGSWDPVVPPENMNGPIKAEGHRVHVVGPKGLFASATPGEVKVRSFANSACETCRLSLFEVTRDDRRAGRPHTHSADEIIYLVSGTIELGAYTLTSGTALCIPGDVRYAEGSGDDGAVFINFRREPSDRTSFWKDKPPTNAPEAMGQGEGILHTNDVEHVFV
jgi:redox-sensitive bicupin YhaK (pirin superfamily)